MVIFNSYVSLPEGIFTNYTIILHPDQTKFVHSVAISDRMEAMPHKVDLFRGCCSGNYALHIHHNTG